MTQESGEADQHINPPSFAPPANRRTRPSAQIPSSAVNAARSSVPQYRPHRSVNAADQDVPASFAPPASRRSSAASAPATPPAFSPNAARRRSSASSGQGTAPKSMAPAQARRSSGSSRNAVRQSSAEAASVLRPQHGITSGLTSNRGTAPAAVAQSHAKRLSAGKIAACAFAVVAALLVLSVFGAWGWVNSRLNKADWLTSAADTPASTWLILGSDERDDPNSDVTGFRTDTILVLTKPKSGPSSLISIPRDSLRQIDGQYMKINAVAQLLGRKVLVQQIEDITGQKIDHVAQIKFGGLEQVVDALGGVQLCYDQDVNDVYSGLNWQAGCHDANGSVALAFSRMRYSDANGDFGRNERQRQVIAAVVKKASSKETLMNPKKVMAVGEASLSALSVDEKASPMSLLDMALAFKDATGSKGISGSVYWSDPNYYVDGVGSSVLLDDQKNTELFNQLAAGTHVTGVVGTLAEG
ncbi:LCP family protein [Bifidobacterium felsineum]|uniref:LCP family protein n=1 Tax=Bifidobacterium felsineum TaxID=2045440 RepID=UPI0013FD1324